MNVTWILLNKFRKICFIIWSVYFSHKENGYSRERRTRNDVNYGNKTVFHGFSTNCFSKEALLTFKKVEHFKFCFPHYSVISWLDSFRQKHNGAVVRQIFVHFCQSTSVFFILILDLVLERSSEFKVYRHLIISKSMEQVECRIQLSLIRWNGIIAEDTFFVA